MNKIYKVVWSKVKNCYVVVSELAKNVISGSVKSAKVGVAPMARGMALGALMAFVITGNGMFDGVAEAADQYIPAKGDRITVKTQNNEYPAGKEDYYVTGSGDRVVGGWNYLTGVTATTLNSDITVTGGEFNMVMGGNYVNGVVTDMTVEKTNIVIDGATVKQLIGGTALHNVNDADDADGRTTNVTINSGYLGTDNDNTNCPEKHVVAGDLIKASAYKDPIGSNADATSSIEKTNLTINDGTFDAAVYGGSAVVRVYGAYESGELKATVEEANVNIAGGTFNDAIAAGGLAWGHETDSIVKNANLTISGKSGKLDVNCDIFAGGLDGSLGAGYETAISKVESAVITIDNATVGNVYGTGGTLNPTDTRKEHTSGIGSSWTWTYAQNTDADAVVDTDLTLENVNAQFVDVQKGSITLKGNNSAKKINAGKDALMVMSGTGGELSAQVNAKDAYFNMGTNNTWNVTAESEVGTLYGDKGEIVVDAEDIDTTMVEIDNNEATGMMVKASGLSLKGGAKQVLSTLPDKLKNTVKVNSGNDVVLQTAVIDTELRGDVELKDGKVTTTMDTDDLVVEGDVKAGNVSLQDTANRVTEVEEKNAIQDNRLDAIDAKNKVQDNRLNAVEQKNEIQDNRLDAIDIKNATQDSRLDGIDAKNEAQDSRLEAVEEKAANQNARLDGIDEKNATQDTRLDGIDSKNATQDTRLDGIDSKNATQDTRLDGIDTKNKNQDTAISDNANAISGLNSRVERLDGKIDKVGAGAAALAALHPLDYDPEEKLTFSAGVGSYGGEQAAALGMFYRPNESVMLSLGGTMGNGEEMVNLGVSFALDGVKGLAKMSKAELIQEVNAVKAENETMKAENEAMEDRIERLEALVAELAAKK